MIAAILFWDGETGRSLYADFRSHLKNARRSPMGDYQFAISATWSRDANLMGANAAHARFAIDRRGSPHGSTPFGRGNRNAMLSSSPSQLETAPSPEIGIGTRIRPSHCCRGAYSKSSSRRGIRTHCSIDNALLGRLQEPNGAK